MTTAYKIYEFPTFPISKQLFHVPGQAIEGGFTSGGARIMSPEPGGFSMLEIQPSLQVREFEYPVSSWLMSKSNGQLLRVRLAPTPQLVASGLSVPWGAQTIYPDSPWSNLANWAGDIVSTYVLTTLQGSNRIVIDMSAIGPILKPGHVIGHAFDTYLIDEISYSGSIATAIVIPPIRRNITVGDIAYFRPWFTGYIANGADIRATYDAENAGHIQIGKIVLNEAVL